MIKIINISSYSEEVINEVKKNLKHTLPEITFKISKQNLICKSNQRNISQQDLSSIKKVFDIVERTKKNKIIYKKEKKKIYKKNPINTLEKKKRGSENR
jgi:hypothetical protein